MRKSDLTLNNVVKRAKSGGSYQISDFMTSEEKRELRRSNFEGKKVKRKFDEIDAFVAEIIARFGYDAYRAWNAGEIRTEHISRLLLAERARERGLALNLETIIVATVSSAVKRRRGEPMPKGLKLANKIIKEEIKLAKGEL